MDITTLLGIVVSGALVIISIIMGGSGAWFINYPSLMIVMGGTMGATLLSFPLSEVLGVFRVVKNVFQHATHSPQDLIRLMVDMAKRARREGILSFEAQISKISDPFLAKGLQLAVDGMESTSIEEILRVEIQHVEERHGLGAEIFTTMGSYAPAMGMLGTIIGLVQMLMQMEDPSQIGEPMAVALLTTFYGVVLSNMVFVPIAGKLKTRSKQEIILKRMIIEGIISIQSGDNHRVVEAKLNAFLSPKERVG